MRTQLAMWMMLTAMTAHAADGAAGAIAAVSDYVYRGISQSRGHPALQADVHYSMREWSLGLWGSSVELNGWEGRTGELNAYVVRRFSFSNDWTAKATLVHYEYPWNSRALRYDYNEGIATLAYRATLFFNVAWSPDLARPGTGYYARTNSFSTEVATVMPLRAALSLNVAAGYLHLPEFHRFDYFYWNAGVGYDVGAWRIDLNYIGATSAARRLYFGDVAGDRIAASLLWRY